MEYRKTSQFNPIQHSESFTGQTFTEGNKSMGTFDLRDWYAKECQRHFQLALNAVGIYVNRDLSLPGNLIQISCRQEFEGNEDSWLISAKGEDLFRMTFERCRGEVICLVKSI